MIYAWLRTHRHTRKAVGITSVELPRQTKDNI